MSPDPVSWYVVEPGWKVTASDRESVGKVHRIVGDANLDIFDGLTITQGGGILDKPKYLPAEQVERIVEGEIVVAAGAQLEDYDEPPPPVDLARKLSYRP